MLVSRRGSVTIAEVRPQFNITKSKRANVVARNLLRSQHHPAGILYLLSSYNIHVPLCSLGSLMAYIRHVHPCNANTRTITDI
jgi:hypothetical protein